MKTRPSPVPPSREHRPPALPGHRAWAVLFCTWTAGPTDGRRGSPSTGALGRSEHTDSGWSHQRSADSRRLHLRLRRPLHEAAFTTRRRPVCSAQPPAPDRPLPAAHPPPRPLRTHASAGRGPSGWWPVLSGSCPVPLVPVALSSGSYPAQAGGSSADRAWRSPGSAPRAAAVGPALSASAVLCPFGKMAALEL